MLHLRRAPSSPWSARAAAHPRPDRLRARFAPVLAVLVLLLAGIPPVGAAPATPAATPAPTVSGYDDVLPDRVDAVRAATERDVSRYTMDVAVDPEAGTIGGRMTIAFVDRYGEPLDALYLRLFPNGDHYGDGGTVVRDVTVDGHPVETTLSAEDTVLALPLARPLAPGGTATVALSFVTTVPPDSDGSYGILSRSTTDGTWALADWYPILAGYQPAPGPGWRLDPPFDGIDPTFGDVALYDVALDAAGLEVVSTGTEVGAADDDGWTRLAAGPVRDFTLVLGDGWDVATRQAGETTVRYATHVDDPAAVSAVLDTVTGALDAYGARFGAYPYRELDLADVALTSGTLGVSWAGLVQLDGPSLAARAGDQPFLDFLLAHEVGHQWWAGLVGFDSNDHTFLAEGLTNYVMTCAVEWTRGRDAAVDMLRTMVAPGYLALLRTGADGVADTPYPEAPAGFGALLYGKAALGFLAIRLEVGDDAFLAALRALASDGPGGFGFRVAEPDDVLAAFEAASGRDLTDLWDHWFRRADTTPDEVAALIDRYAAG